MKPSRVVADAPAAAADRGAQQVPLEVGKNDYVDDICVLPSKVSTLRSG